MATPRYLADRPKRLLPKAHNYRKIDLPGRASRLDRAEPELRNPLTGAAGRSGNAARLVELAAKQGGVSSLYVRGRY